MHNLTFKIPENPPLFDGLDQRLYDAMSNSLHNVVKVLKRIGTASCIGAGLLPLLIDFKYCISLLSIFTEYLYCVQDRRLKYGLGCAVFCTSSLPVLVTPFKQAQQDVAVCLSTAFACLTFDFPKMTERPEPFR